MAKRKDVFENQPIQSDGPAIGSMEIAPSDLLDLPRVIRAITLATAGKISWIAARDGAEEEATEVVESTGTLPPGTYPIFAKRIRNTGTTATGLTGWV